VLTRTAARIWLIIGLATTSACGTLVENNVLPPGVRDPDETRTPQGALAAYNGVRFRFREAFDRAALYGALLTDELGTNVYGQPLQAQPPTLDRRYLPEGIYEDRYPYGNTNVPLYDLLHLVRGQASEAVGLLSTYAPDTPPALRGHAYALSAYAEILLADLYCSGVPLSTVDFNGDYTLRSGSTTEQVYEHALALLDTALTLAADSARIRQFVEVGRGRTLLALGRYAEAGAAVGSVPDGFRYEVTYDAAKPSFMLGYFDGAGFSSPSPFDGATMTNREGGSGLDYLSSRDSRVASDSLGTNYWGYPIYMPAKYRRDGIGPMVVADGVEARLIEAEAALQAGEFGTWLAKLNELRETAITPPLPDTTDPGSSDPEARQNLTFRERAFWLFVTGHRQGDLRRVARVYGRDENTVYPTGVFPDGQGVYGSDVTMPIPRDELIENPRFTGCLGRGA
jgi:hypothetical protein